jgi:hypothetical protein
MDFKKNKAFYFPWYKRHLTFTQLETMSIARIL